MRSWRPRPRDNRCSPHRRVADTAGLGPIPIDFELVRGIVVRGRLTDGETGKPVKGDVEYYPLATNPRAESLGATRYFQPSSRSVTDAEGNYAVVALPGPGALAVAAWGGRWDRYLAARIDRQELKRVAPQTPDSNRDTFAPVEVGGPLLLSNYNELKLMNPPDGGGPAPPSGHRLTRGPDHHRSRRRAGRETDGGCPDSRRDVPPIR